jgi:hydrogenase maturation protein HypF
MLPYTPLHHLLLNNLQIPIVATSGNLSDEPICVDEQEALERLGGIADLFLIHNRPIRTRGDDSIARIVLGREMILRRARGYAPLPIYLNEGEHATTPAGVMAVGAHLKNTIALRKGRQVFLSQHLGDLDNTESYEAFLRTTHDFPGYYGTQVEQLVCDLHPDYLATQFAVNSQKPVCQVQHHYAHILSCMAENQIDAPVLGVAWDGTGYGLDGEIWGGEFFLVEESSFRRIAHLRSFPLPGGEAAIKDLRRIVLGLLYEMEGDNTRSYLPAHFQNFGELEIILEMLRKSINCPRVCSIGRLFDVVACLCRIKEKVSFEGQAAMELEYMARGMANTQALSPYPSLRCGEGENAIIDWAPMIKQILDDLRKQIPVGEVALRFHNTLVELILTIARRVGIPRVVLSGGCFQNQILLTQAVTRLQELGFQPYWHQRVPPNDGGIALGQIMAFSRDSKMRGSS